MAERDWLTMLANVDDMLTMEERDWFRDHHVPHHFPGRAAARWRSGRSLPGGVGSNPTSDNACPFWSGSSPKEQSSIWRCLQIVDLFQPQACV